MLDPEEQTLLLQLKQASTRDKAFRILLGKYQSRVYYLIRKMVENHDDADDLTQDTFVKVYRNIDKFKEDASLFTWIYRIATNEALSFLSKNNRRRSSLIAHGIDSTEGSTQQGTLDADAIQSLLKAAIHSLPDKQKLVFQMRYYEDLSYESMSQILGTSVGSLKASYHHAVKKIEVFLGKSLNH